MTTPGKIKIVTAHMDCGMCPTIYIGTTDDGSTVYARFRWGLLSVRLDPRNPPPDGGAAGAWIYNKQLDPEGMAGGISYEELQEITADLIDWPAELTPRTYEESDADDLSDLL